ncbi:MAG: hypothetical protein AB1351_08220 [Thermoproteota archaeon]
MVLDDFLLPAENIRFSSNNEIVEYGDKKYRVLVTDQRLILYARRGTLVKSDDIVSERLDLLHGLKYLERGTILRSAAISIQGSLKIEIRGSPSHLKPLYHSLQAIIGKK